jgi:curli biogenesis system outer membrane secretion channel CsgG
MKISGLITDMKIDKAGWNIDMVEFVRGSGLLFLAMIFLSGCSQKITIRAIEPAEVDRASLTKKVSVVPFQNDRVGISDKIEANLANQKFENKNYFTLINRKDFDKIIAEQKIQNSGLVELSTAVEVGNLIGAEAIISGNAGSASSSDTHYYENRVACADKKCKEFVNYQVGCTKRVVSLSAEIRMVDVSKGDIIYADTMNKSLNFSHCSDDSHPLPSTQSAAQNLANIIADGFTRKLVPHYRYFEVVLLEKPDIKYNNKEEKLLELSLEYIKQNRLDKAEQFLVDLIDSTNQKSYVAFYNLGVIKEANGQYVYAQKYYKKADELMIDPAEEVSSAYIRIESLIQKSNIAKEQLAK